MTRLLGASVEPLGSAPLRFPRQKTVSAGPGLEFSGVRQPGPQVPNLYQASLAAPSAASSCARTSHAEGLDTVEETTSEVHPPPE
jgi:hypothetical protein